MVDVDTWINSGKIDAQLKEIDDLCVSIAHYEQNDGLKKALALATSLKGTQDMGRMREVLPNVIRHLERSGYPAVVGASIEALKVILLDESIQGDFRKWHGFKRLVATLGHKHVDVQVAALVLFAQLAKNKDNSDDIALARAYTELVGFLKSEEERLQLGALLCLRVLTSVESNISDFSRANGFKVLFQLILGKFRASPKILSQALIVLKYVAWNRAVPLEIRASNFDSDLANLANHDDASVSMKALQALEKILQDDAGLKFCKKNGKVLEILTVYVSLSKSAEGKTIAENMITKLK